MNIIHLENVYRANNLGDYVLDNTYDLFRVHGIDYAAIDGYRQLKDEDRWLYEKSIISFFNRFALQYRPTIYPVAINRVEEIRYVTFLKEVKLTVGKKVTAIHKDGTTKILQHYIAPGYSDDDYFQESKPKFYLRLDYVDEGHKEHQYLA